MLYVITWTENGVRRHYIGMSIDQFTRWLQHAACLVFARADKAAGRHRKAVQAVHRAAVHADNDTVKISMILDHDRIVTARKKDPFKLCPHRFLLVLEFAMIVLLPDEANVSPGFESYQRWLHEKLAKQGPATEGLQQADLEEEEEEEEGELHL